MGGKRVVIGVELGEMQLFRGRVRWMAWDVVAGKLENLGFGGDGVGATTGIVSDGA